jgi:hypothetical protein
MRPGKKLLLVIGAAGLLLAIALAVIVSSSIYRLFFPYLDQDVTGQILISSEWTEIVPKKPFSVERQIQMIVLDLDKSINLQKDGWGIVLADGSVVTPEVELIDQEGNTYPLDVPSAWFSPSTGVKYREFSSKNELPSGKIFRAVRVRSEKPVRCNRVFWRCYNMWDVS